MFVRESIVNRLKFNVDSNRTLCIIVDSYSFMVCSVNKLMLIDTVYRVYSRCIVIIRSNQSASSSLHGYSFSHLFHSKSQTIET